MERVRTHIEKNLDRPVRLEELGRAAGMSPFTVQRLFKREMGVSPLGYQRALRARSLRKALKQGDDVTTAIYEAGFGSSSRAYDGAQLGMTPSRFAAGRQRRTDRMVHGALALRVDHCRRQRSAACAGSRLPATAAEAEASLREEFPLAELRRDPSLARWVELAVANVMPQARAETRTRPRPNLWTCAEPRSNCACGRRCVHIPRGETRSYSQLAREMGDPKVDARRGPRLRH